MRQDQFEKLISLEEKIFDELIVAADPAYWEGAGLRPDQMTKETRGNRHWCIKGAAAMLALGQRMNGLIGQVRSAADGENPQPGSPDMPTEDDIDQEIASAEAEAKRMINRAASGSGEHKEFMKRAVTGGK